MHVSHMSSRIQCCWLAGTPQDVNNIRAEKGPAPTDTGSLVGDGEPHGASGDIRGFDAKTGKLLWRFHTVPRPGEFGNDTWEGESWKDRGGVKKTGTPNLGGSIVTAGGPVFIAATNDRRFRAFDKDTGAELWVTLPARERPRQ